MTDVTWQPIEAYPLTVRGERGPEVLFLYEDGTVMNGHGFRHHFEPMSYLNVKRMSNGKPTHFMPLPQPPEEMR